MSNLETNINRINNKLQQLLKNYRQLQKDNERQTQLINRLQESKEKDNLQLAGLQEQLEIVKATAGQLNDADKKAFEKTINRYIREIDKCIGILSE